MTVGTTKRAKTFLRDHRRRAGEKFLVVGILVLLMVGGLRVSSAWTNGAPRCQGAVIQNTGGGVACTQRTDSGVAEGNSAAPPGTAPIACRGAHCLCFVAGTPVMTISGLRPIETLRPGTQVLSRDDHNEELHWRPVLHTFVSQARSLVRLALSDDQGRTETLETTENHPFYVVDSGWLEAWDLTPGRSVLVDWQRGSLHVIAAESLPRRATVYSIEVAEDHTYFVGELGAWVHNQGLVEWWNRKRRPARVSAALNAPHPAGTMVPIKLMAPNGRVTFRGRAQIIRVHPDGSFDVQGVNADGPFQARSDGRGRAYVYPPVGSRLRILLPDGYHEVLIISRNPDGSSEFEANINGRRNSGTLPLRRNGIDWHPEPPKVRYQSGDAIAGHYPDEQVLHGGTVVTAIGNILIEHPSGPPDPRPYVENARQEFVASALNDLATIDSTPSGQALLASLQRPAGPAAGQVVIHFTNGYEYGAPDAVATSHNTLLSNWDATNNGPGPGTWARVRYNPWMSGLPVRPAGDIGLAASDADNMIGFENGQGRAQHWPADTALFHELVHASDVRRGVIIPNNVGESSIGVSEERAVGLGDFAGAPFSENTYLLDRGLPPRPFYSVPGERHSSDATRPFTAAQLLDAHTNAPGALTYTPPALAPVAAAGPSGGASSVSAPDEPIDSAHGGPGTLQASKPLPPPSLPPNASPPPQDQISLPLPRPVRHLPPLPSPSPPTSGSIRITDDPSEDSAASTSADPGCG